MYLCRDRSFQILIVGVYLLFFYLAALLNRIQDGTQAYSQGPLTQGGMSMSQPYPMSQPGLSGLSQPELSQVSLLA